VQSTEDRTLTDNPNELPSWRSPALAARLAVVLARHRFRDVPINEARNHDPERLRHFEAGVALLDQLAEGLIEVSRFLDLIGEHYQPAWRVYAQGDDPDWSSAMEDAQAVIDTFACKLVDEDIEGLRFGESSDQCDLELQLRWEDMTRGLPSAGNEYDAFCAAWIARGYSMAEKIANCAVNSGRSAS
jgi:hypothetical protein